MGTGKYPEEIVEKVAKAIFVWDTSEGINGPHWARLSTEQRDVWREAAIAALDALGLEREVQGPRFYKDSSSARYVTPWRSIND